MQLIIIVRKKNNNLPPNTHNSPTLNTCICWKPHTIFIYVFFLLLPSSSFLHKNWILVTHYVWIEWYLAFNFLWLILSYWRFMLKNWFLTQNTHKTHWMSLVKANNNDRWKLKHINSISTRLLHPCARQWQSIQVDDQRETNRKKWRNHFCVFDFGWKCWIAWIICAFGMCMFTALLANDHSFGLHTATNANTIAKRWNATEWERIQRK